MSESSYRFKILIVDDDSEFRSLLVEALADMGYFPEGTDTVEQAVRMAQLTHYSIIFTELSLPHGVSGLDLLRTMRESYPKTLCILMTAYVTTDSAIQALRAGAFDFILKPFKLVDFEASLMRALNHCISLRDAEFRQFYLEKIFRERNPLLDNSKELYYINPEILVDPEDRAAISSALASIARFADRPVLLRL